MKKFTASVVCLFYLVCIGLAQTPQTKVEPPLLPEYDLSVHLLPDRHRIEISGTWRLPAIAAERSQIEFYLSPKMENFQVEIVEPQTSAPLVLESSKEEGGDLQRVKRILKQNGKLRKSNIKESRRDVFEVYRGSCGSVSAPCRRASRPNTRRETSAAIL